MSPTVFRTIAVLLLSWPGLFVAAEEDMKLRCLSESETVSASLYPRLQREAYSALEQRAKKLEELTDSERIREYQQRTKEFFYRQIGGKPASSPLNAQTVRTIDEGTYRIEVVIFDSQPNHRITANLYLPRGSGPFPGVVVSSGHSRTAKTADYNQRFGIALSNNGIAALCIDPIGQGERSQILTPMGEVRFNGTTTEHTLMGVGSILVGRNTASYRIWDGQRAIDYLQSRSDIDGQRIGYTGCSGGGTLTSYVMALDDRVTCAAPACYLTTFQRLIETQGPQDAEQNIAGQILFGMDHPDYVMMRAPRPTLIVSTTGDFFSIQGAWETFRQAKQIFGRLGYPERVDLVEVDGDHGVQPQSLATVVHWMRRWLLDIDEPVPVTDWKVRSPDELICLPAGQVLADVGEKSVFQLNADYEKSLSTKRQETWKLESPQSILEKIRERINVKLDRPEAKFEDLGRVPRDGYHIDKLVLRVGEEVPIPGLTFHPESPEEDAYLYLHPQGKLGDAESGGRVEQLVRKGYAVVTVDLRGQGETGSGNKDELLGDWRTYFLGYLIGKPLLGMRVEDTITAGQFVAAYQLPSPKKRKVHLVAVGQAGIVALHAAALQPELFASLTLHELPGSWASSLAEVPPANSLEYAVHGALELYDFPDLKKFISCPIQD